MFGIRNKSAKLKNDLDNARAEAEKLLDKIRGVRHDLQYAEYRARNWERRAMKAEAALKNLQPRDAVTGRMLPKNKKGSGV